MKDNRTEIEKYQAWLTVVNICASNGWQYVREWVFKSPSGSLHDLSSADLKKLDRIEYEGHFLVEPQMKDVDDADPVTTDASHAEIRRDINKIASFCVELCINRGNPLRAQPFREIAERNQ